MTALTTDATRIVSDKIKIRSTSAGGIGYPAQKKIFFDALINGYPCFILNAIRHNLIFLRRFLWSAGAKLPL